MGDLLDKFTKERLKQVGDNQETFGESEIDAIIPLLKELVEGRARGYVLAVEFKDGTRMIHKFRPSIELVEILLDELMGMK